MLLFLVSLFVTLGAIKIKFKKKITSFHNQVFQTPTTLQKAEAELAYELQAAKEKQKIRGEEMEIEVVERRKLIEVEEKEILRKEKELISIIKRPAESEAYRMEAIAEGSRFASINTDDDDGNIKNNYCKMYNYKVL